jgi:hypothetical protein
MSSAIVAFYDGKGTDHQGRTLEEILAWDDDSLEYTHDYIQWLFPLREPSAFNPWAPVLTESDVGTFRGRSDLQSGLRRAFDRMMLFYGFTRPAKQWLGPHNHNFLRLTRILTSTRLLGLEEESRGLFRELEAVYAAHPAIIGPVTWRFWREAGGNRPGDSA